MWRRLGSSVTLGCVLALGALTLARAEPVDLAGIKYEDVVDNSILEKLDKSGFIDGLYK